MFSRLVGTIGASFCTEDAFRKLSALVLNAGTHITPTWPFYLGI